LLNLELVEKLKGFKNILIGFVHEKIFDVDILNASFRTNYVQKQPLKNCKNENKLIVSQFNHFLNKKISYELQESEFQVYVIQNELLIVQSAEQVTPFCL